VRCFYAADPTKRPDCTLTATIRLGPIALFPPCQARRSTVGKSIGIRRHAVQPSVRTLMTVSRHIVGSATVVPSGRGDEAVARRSRLAGVALVLVLLGVSVFAVWSSQATSQAASRAVTASGLSDAYDEAANAVGGEESLERKYRLEPARPARR